MNGFKLILFFSVLFITVNSTHGNSPKAISGKDSLIIIFKGPTLLQDESLNNTRIVSRVEFHLEIAETLINHFQPFDKMGNATSGFLAIKNVFAPGNSEFSPHMSGILNFGKYGISTQNFGRVLKSGIME